MSRCGSRAPSPLLVAALMIAACSSPTAPPVADAGTSMSMDVTPDTGSPTVDAGTSPPMDVTPDTGSPTVDVRPDVPGTPCTSDRTCSAMGGVCDRDRGLCVECRTRADCTGTNTACIAQRCAPITMCTTTRQCPGQVCNTTLAYCVDCNADGDCATGQLCRENSCVARPRTCTSSRQCSDLALVCDMATSTCVECVGDNDCAAGMQFCAAGGRCLARVCATGAARCAADGRRELCNARGSAYDATACASTESCREGACVARVCVPGAARCAAGSLTSREVCNADGLGYTATACASNESCGAGVCMARVCVPAATSCVGTTGTRMCNADGLGYGATTACPAMNSCTASTGMCGGWACTPGSATCVGNSRQVCNPDGLASTTTACGASQTCSAGVCANWLCTPGSFSCTDINTRRVCNADGLGYGAAACPAMNACLGLGMCAAWTCAPGTATCASLAARSVCNADGQTSATLPCGSSESCSVGVCRTRICTAGALRCASGSTNTVETCAADGLSWSASPCGAGQSCSGGACVAWLCSPGTPGCVGSTGTRSCNADGLGYGATTACGGGTSCNPTTQLCGAWVCTPGSATCVGNSRQVCNPDGLASTTTACSASQTCTAGICAAQICTPGSFSCTDINTRRVCNADGLGYGTAACPAMNACLGVGVCTPWMCTPGSAGMVCASTTARQVCNADGQGYATVACAAGQSCSGGDCVTPACPAGTVLVPAGSFMMGDADTASDGAQPPHMVTMSAYCMDLTEVTVAAYRGCTATGCTPPSSGGSYNWGVTGRDNHPINGVNWNQARAYCQSLGRDLPTEAQWEYAARGTDGRIYPWGNTAPASQLCWNRTTSCAVQSFPSGNSPFGLSDMAGSVWEWTLDWYAIYTAASSSNPTGPVSVPAPGRRLIRGGAWNDYNPTHARSAFRNNSDPATTDPVLGFRCARTLSSAPSSCAAILAATPGSPSGIYTIDPDGAGSELPASVYCDMTTMGGGWTLVFVPTTTNYGSLTIPYTYNSAALRTWSTEALIALRSQSQLATASQQHRFPIPSRWRTASPMSEAGTSEAVSWTSTVASGSGTLHYGYQNWNGSTCSGTFSSSLANFGRVCIQGASAAPFYSAFATTAADAGDYCSLSNDTYGTTACSSTRAFTIAFR